MRTLLRVFIVFCVVLSALIAVAQQVNSLPPLIRFSGTLRNATGQSLPGTVGVTFALYKDEHDASPLWIETQNVSLDAAGRYTVLLGSEHAHGIDPGLFATSEPRWIGVTPENSPELPRILLATVPYAMKAADADTLGGHPASAYLLATAGQQTPAATSSSETKSATVFTAGTGDSGTPNTLAKFVTTSTLGSSLLTDTGSAIGVRISDPEQVFDVLGRAQYRTEGIYTAGFFLRGSDAGPRVFVGQTGPNSGDPFAIWHTSGWRLVVDAAGNVGINNPAPDFRFDVMGRMRVKAEGPASAGIFLGPSDAGPSLFLGQLGTNASDPFAIWHGGAWRMVVDAAGRVGIGTTAPSASLEVAGNVRISSGGALTFADGTSINSAPRATNITAADTSLAVSSDANGASIRVSNAGITSTHLAANSVTTAAILDGSITGAKLATATVSPAAIVGTAATLGANNFIGDQSIRGGVFARNYATTGTSQAVQGRTDSNAGIAIEAIASSTTGGTIALHANNSSSAGSAVFAEATSPSGTNYGVKSTTAGVAGSAAVLATASSTASDLTYGVRGDSASGYGVGVMGYATSPTGTTKGVSGKVESASGTAGEFNNYGGGTILAGYNNTDRVFRVDGTGSIWTDGILHTGGGADFAEMVAITGAREQYSAGDVLVISTTTDRSFALSSQPYSTTVAGIYSTRPGVLGSQHSQNATQPADEIPLAVIGIVPCRASAENGPIRRGDLLVTSSIPGHVMKGTERTRMLGAIVGKALSSLDSGTGTIEILVTLQ